MDSIFDFAKVNEPYAEGTPWGANSIDWTTADPFPASYKTYLDEVAEYVRSTAETKANDAVGSDVRVVVDTVDAGTFALHVLGDEADDDPEILKAYYKPSSSGLIEKGQLVTEQTAVSHMTDLGETFISHHGVKGMKWGVRRERNAQNLKDAAEKAAPVVKRGGAALKRGAKSFGRGLSSLVTQMADSSWENSIYNDAKHEEVHNKVTKDLEDHVLRLQVSPKYRNKNLRTDSDLRKSYYEDVAKVTDASYKRSVKETYGENYSGTKSAHYVHDARGPRIEIRDKKTGMPEKESPLPSMREIETRRRIDEANARVGGAGSGTSKFGHADSFDAPDLFIDLVLDDNGLISGVKYAKPSADDAMAQTMEIGEAFLFHYGVKGMKWGVRKDQAGPGFGVTRAHIEARQKAVEARRREARPAQDTQARDTIGPTKYNKTKIKTKGGEDHPAHDDAVNTALIEQKLKKSGPAALSNQELRIINERMQLEQNTARLVSERKNNGKGFVSNLLKKNSKQTVDRGVQKVFNQAGDKALDEAARRARRATDR